MMIFHTSPVGPPIVLAREIMEYASIGTRCTKRSNRCVVRKALIEQRDKLIVVVRPSRLPVTVNIPAVLVKRTSPIGSKKDRLGSNS